MIRGTTATFKFKLPYVKDELDWVTIKFWQSNNPSKLLPITKTKQHCDSAEDSKELCVSLTPEETSRFSDKYKAMVQLRAQHIVTGTVFGNDPQTITVYPMRDDIIEDNPTLPVENNDGYIIFDGDVIIK